MRPRDVQGNAAGLRDAQRDHDGNLDAGMLTLWQSVVPDLITMDSLSLAYSASSKSGRALSLFAESVACRWM